MKRILFVVESLCKLGPAETLLRLVSELREIQPPEPASREWDAQSLELHIAVLNCQPAHISVFESKLRSLNVAVHPLGAEPTHHPVGRPTSEAIYELRKLVGAIQPDIVHSWCGMAEYATLVATEFPSRLSSKPIRRFATELYVQPEKRFVRQVYENRISSGFEKTIVSHELIRDYKIRNGANADNIVVVQKSFDAGEFSQTDRTKGRELILEKFGLPPDSKIAGTVAPWVPRTRLKDLIWATDLLTCIREDFHLILIGEGPQEQRLRKFARLAGSPKHCHFVSPSDEAESMLAGFDFYWHSHLQEPLPENMLKAMSAGVPVISVYGPGTQEIIRHQETGFAVNFGARDEFGRWTKYIIELPEPARMLANQGQKFVQQQFANSAMASECLELYQAAEVYT